MHPTQRSKVLCWDHCVGYGPGLTIILDNFNLNIPEMLNHDHHPGLHVELGMHIFHILVVFELYIGIDAGTPIVSYGCRLQV